MKIINKLKYSLIFFAAAILLLLCSVGVSASTQTSDGTVDFVILLDCTKSMETADVTNICEAAAKMFTDLAPSNNARVAIVAFGNTWSPVYTFTSTGLGYMNDTMGNYARSRVCQTVDLSIIDSINIRQEIKNLIHTRMSEDIVGTSNTYIGGGLMVALDVLEKNLSDEAAIILMSDGRLSGFNQDKYDGVKVEWSLTNAELVDEAVEYASNKGWKIYTIELNDDGKNTSYSQARVIMSNMAKKTDATSQEIRNVSIGSLVNGFIDIFGNFMDANANTQQKVIKGGECSFTVSIPDVTSETNIIITGGLVSSISVDGTEYSDNNYTNAAYFVKNQDNHYTLLKLFTPKAGFADVVVKGSDGAVINVQVVNTQDLPVGLTTNPGDDRVARNTSVEFHAFLANPESGEAVSAQSFYSEAPATLTITNSTTGTSAMYDMESIADGYTLSHEFTDMGEYDVTVYIRSEHLRGGGKEFTRHITVENYGFVSELDSHKSGDVIACEEVLKIDSYFTDPYGRPIIGSDIYCDDEAEVTVYKNSTKIAGPFDMIATESGYTYDYVPTAVGAYSFSVTTTAACLHGDPSSMRALTDEYICKNYNFDAVCKIESFDGNELTFTDGGEYSKSSIVKLTGSLYTQNGTLVTNSSLFGKDAAKVTVWRNNSEKIAEFTMNVPEGESNFVSEWRIDREGELEIRVTLNNDASTTKTFRLNATNEKPSIVKKIKNTSIYVGQSLTIPVADHFYDGNHDPLNFNLIFDRKNVESEVEWRISEDCSNIIINTGNRSDDIAVTVKADDNDASVSLEFKLKIENRAIEKTDSIVIPHFVLNPPPFMFFVKYDNSPLSFALNDYYRDPDGFDLTFDLTPQTEKVYLDEKNVLHIAPDAPMNEKFTLVVADSDNDTEKFTFTVQADNWWTLNITRFLITVVIIGIIIAVGIIIFKRESQIGKIRIESIFANGKFYDINESLNEKRIKKSTRRFKDICVGRLMFPDDKDSLRMLMATDKTVVVGHLIFGSAIKLKNISAASVEINDEEVKGNRIRIKSGAKVTVTLRNGTQIVFFNYN